MFDQNEAPKPQPIKLPLPCFGDGYKAVDPKCKACPHRVSCIEAMGRRLTHIPLSRAAFNLVPADYNLVYEKTFIEDPEIADLERIYIDGYRTVFKKHPTDRAKPLADKIVEAARRKECSVRLYVLANMLGHSIQEGKIKLKTGRAFAKPFKAKHLIGKIAELRAETYRDVCGKEYGTFSVSSLRVLTGVPVDTNSAESRLLNSEVKVGHFIVDWKTRQGGPVYEALYSELELTLDPFWLAIEDSYKATVLDRHIERPRGSDAEKNHRFSVTQTIAYLKKHKQAACAMFITRESIMAKAISDVLRLFGYGPDDFLIVNQPITDPINMWAVIGLAVQHHQCLRYLDGEHSMLFRS